MGIEYLTLFKIIIFVVLVLFLIKASLSIKTKMIISALCLLLLYYANTGKSAQSFHIKIFEKAQEQRQEKEEPSSPTEIVNNFFNKYFYGNGDNNQNDRKSFNFGSRSEYFKQ